MEFSTYYVLRNLEDSLPEDLLRESVDAGYAARFSKETRKKSSMLKLVNDYARKYPKVRRCDVEDAILDSLTQIIKRKPSDSSSAKRMLKKQINSFLSEISKKGKAAKRSLSCIRSIKSFSVKGMNIDEIIGKAKGILTANEKMALDLCSGGHSVRQMALIMKVSFATAWRILNRALDKVRISHGMKSRNRDRR
jgi:predicted DNA-binding protein (UPF0251 family)